MDTTSLRKTTSEDRMPSAIPTLSGVEPFLRALSSSEPTPGGGASAALIGSVACAQAVMVATLSLANKTCQKDEKRMEQLEALQRSLAQKQDAFLTYANSDAKAYERLSRAFKLPRETEEEQAARKERLECDLVQATEPPFATLEMAHAALVDVSRLVDIASRMAKTDLIVSSLALLASARGAEAMVRANTIYMSDATNAQAYDTRAAKLADATDSLARATQDALRSDHRKA